MGGASRRKWEAMLERAQLLLQGIPEQKNPMQPPHKVLLAASVAMLIAGGLTVIFVFFWFGVFLMYAGAVILAIDLLCHPWNWKWKSVAMLIPAIIIVPTSMWAFGSAPLQA